MLYLKDYRDTAYLQSVLDGVGSQIPPSLPYHIITIPGKFIAEKRFSIGVRAMEVLKASCDKINIDLSIYDIVAYLEPKGSYEFQNVGLEVPQEPSFRE